MNKKLSKQGSTAGKDYIEKEKQGYFPTWLCSFIFTFIAVLNVDRIKLLWKNGMWMHKCVVMTHSQPDCDPLPDILHKNSPKNDLDMLSPRPPFTPALIQNTSYSSYEWSIVSFTHIFYWYPRLPFFNAPLLILGFSSCQSRFMSNSSSKVLWVVNSSPVCLKTSQLRSPFLNES